LLSASNYTLSVGGDWSNSGTFNERSGKVKFTGTGNIGAETFYDLEVNASGTHTLTGAVTVTNDLTITAGTLDVGASNYTLSVGRGLE